MSNPPEKDTGPDRLLTAVEGYWQALQAGVETDPAVWLHDHPADRDFVGELQLAAALFHTREVLREDSHVTDQEWTQHHFLAPGTRLRDCRIESLLGCGGMGEVYLAHHEKLDRKVAVKVLPEDVATDPDAVKRFQKSVQLLARLEPHPNLATAMDAGEQDGRHFLIMEYVAGMDLQELVQREGPLPADKACAFMRQAAAGLAHAHRGRVIHRDVKPSNLILMSLTQPCPHGGEGRGTGTPEGTIKVIDLGLARQSSLEDESSNAALTREGVVLGTRDYLAPEQARNPRDADERSDLYSLGCTFYFLLTGRAPFSDRNPHDKLVAHAVEEPARLDILRPEVPSAAATLVHRLMSKKPEDRLPSAQAVIEALDAVKTNAVALPGTPRIPRRPRFKLVAALLLMAVFVGAAALAIIRISAPEGDYVIDTDDPDFAFSVSKGSVILEDKKTKRKYNLKVVQDKGSGEFELEINDPDHGLLLNSKTFTIKRGQRVALKAWFERRQVAGMDPAEKFTPSELKPIPFGQSPFDRLDPSAIPEAERFPWQPKELVAVIGEHRQRNWGGVLALSIRPTGEQVAANNEAGEDGFWAIPSGAVMSKLEGYFFHPDSRHLLGGRSKVWDVSGATPLLLGEIPGRTKFFSASRDGSLILSWGRDWDYTLLFDCSDLRKIKEIAKIPNAVRSALSPDGRFIAVQGAGAAAPVRILEWDGTDAKVRYELPEKAGHGSYGMAAPPFCFILDGRLGLCNHDGVFQLWDISGKVPKVVASTPTVNMNFPVVSPDGKRLALSNEYSTVSFWRIEGSKLENTGLIYDADLRLSGSHAHAVAFLPGGNRVVTGHLNGAVRFWDITEKRAREINPLKAGLTRIFEVSPDGKWLIVRGDDRRFTRYSFGGRTPQEQPLAKNIGPGFSGDRISSNASVVRADKLYGLLDEPTEISLAAVGTILALSPTGTSALIAKDDEDRISLWSLTGKREQLTDWTAAPTKNTTDVIAPNGRHVLRRQLGGNISLWLHTGRQLTKTSEVKIEGTFAGMTFTDDGNTVAVFPVNNPVMLYAVRDDKLVPLPGAPFDRLHGDGCFSPDGKQLARCGYGPVQVYDYPSGKLRHEWTFPGIVQRVRFAPDGRHLLVHGYNGVLYILRLPQGASAAAPGVKMPLATPPQKLASPEPKRAGQSALDKLDPSAIPQIERFPWQPKELVAVIGQHHQRATGQAVTLSVRPDGLQVISVNEPGGNTAYDVSSGKLLWSEPGRGAYFRPDDKTVFGKATAWDVTGPAPVVIAELGSIGEFCSQSQDGKLALRWDREWTYALLLDCSDLKKIRHLAKIPDVRSGALSPDGKLIAVRFNSADPIRIVEWDGTEVRLRFEMPGKFKGDGFNPPFAFAADGSLGACTAAGIFQLWDVEGKQPKKIAETPKIDAWWPVFSPRGDRLATAFQFAVRFWQIKGKSFDQVSEIRLQEDIPRREGHVKSVAFLPDGKRVVTGHLDGAVRFWDIRGKRAKEINPLPPGIDTSFEFSADGTRLVALQEDYLLTAFRFGAAAPQLQPFAEPLLGKHTLRMAADASAAANAYTLVSLGAELTARVLPAGLQVLALSHDGSLGLLRSAAETEPKIALWSLGKELEALTAQADAPVSSASAKAIIAPNGRHLLIFDGNETASLWVRDGKTLKKTSEFKHESLTGVMAFTPDGGTAAVFPHMDRLLLYDIKDDRLVPRPKSPFWSLHGGGGFSPDGMQLAICGDGLVRVYDYPSAKVRFEWKFPGLVKRVLFAPDCRHLVVNGYNGVLYILRLAQAPSEAAPGVKSPH